MNSRDIFFSTMERKKADRVPVIPYAGNFAPALLGVNIDDYHNDGILMAKCQREMVEITGIDAVIPQSDGYYISEGMGVKTKRNPNALPSHIAPAITSLADISKIKVPNPYNDGRMPIYLEAIARLKQDVGKDKIIRTPGTGPFSLAGHILGTQEFITEIAMAEAEEDDDAKKYLHELMTVCAQSLIEFLKACAKEGADFLMCGDSLASLNMTSPSVYETYAYPYECMVFDELNKLKKEGQFYNILHICGNNTRVKNLLGSTGCDTLEIDYMVDLPAYKRELDEKTCLFGNLNPAGALLNGTPQQVYDESMAVLDIAAKDGHFILGSGCEVAIGTPKENIIAMVKAAEDFGKR